MLCALILYISGGTYSLKSTPNDRFFEKLFIAIMLTFRVLPESAKNNFNVCVRVFCAAIACLHTLKDQNELQKKDFFLAKSATKRTPCSFGGRIKLIICQIRPELSVTIHEISWKKTLDGGPYIYIYIYIHRKLYIWWRFLSRYNQFPTGGATENY